MRYSPLFRWFVGLTIQLAVRDHSVFSKHRDRLLERDVVEAFFPDVMSLKDRSGLLSRVHFFSGRHADSAIGQPKALSCQEWLGR